MSSPTDHPRASRFLERAMLFTILAHAAAMLSMLLLLPGIPGGLADRIAARAGYVAHHPWLWRLGWFPWQLTALSDLLLAIALLCTRWIQKLPAVLTLLVTAGGIVFDQTSQFQWSCFGPGIAASAVRLASYASYTRFDSHAFLNIAGWGTVGYLGGALGWTWCFIAAGTWSKLLTWLSIITWPLFAAATTLLLALPSITGTNSLDAGRPWLLVIGAINGVSFVLLMLWLFAATDRILARSRPATTFGRYAPFRYPATGVLARGCDLLANNRTFRAFGEWIPSLAMASDITDVVYANYLVDADRLAPLVPAPLQLQRLGPNQNYALFTVLTFRHGHFGPRCFGALRRLWPSPIQSNWRIHVVDPASGIRGIQFLTIAISPTPFALVARMLAENIPMHIPATAALSRDAGGSLSFALTSGAGSAPDIAATLTASSPPQWTAPWSSCFASWDDFLAYCVPQDRAMSSQPWYRRLTRQEIALDIPLSACRPLKGDVRSVAATTIAGDVTPLCFIVDRVVFRLLHEVHEE